jgi:uncharacterized RDD family membrane protein YckC
MDWHYTQNNETVGPVDGDQMQSLIAEGTLTADSMVWNSTFTDWQPLSNTELANHLNSNTSENAVSADSNLCSVCKRAFPNSQLVEIGGQQSCALCKPMALKRFQENSFSHEGLNYAGFWIRVGCSIVDILVLMAVNFVIGFVLGFGTISQTSSPEAALGIQLFLQFLQFAVGFTYTTVMIWKYGATLGVMAGGLRIVNADGSNISYLKSVGRYFAYMLNGFTFGIGFIMVAFDKEKRALHDMICDTRVIYKNK